MDIECPIAQTGYTRRNPSISLGRLGGNAGRGKAKARTSAQARAAVAVRWARWRANAKSRAIAREKAEQKKIAQIAARL